MEILLWLVPAAVATLAAMAWVGWVGRSPGVPSEEQDRKRQERFAKALTKPIPGAPRIEQHRRTQDRSTGLALRPSQTRRPRGHDAA